MTLTAVLIGALAGILLTAIAVIIIMRSKMLSTIESPLGYDATCNELEAAVTDLKDNGWSFPMERLDMYGKLAAKGKAPANVKRMMSYFMCNPALAGSVLETNPAISSIMPCTWSIYETTDGRVLISKMNVGLMSRIFGGSIHKTMMDVEETEKEILRRISNKK